MTEATVDDERCSIERMLITFTFIGAAVFEPAADAALSVSRSVGCHPVLAAMRVGKALNDPPRASTPLARLGIALTRKQARTLKARFVLGRKRARLRGQRLILREIQAQVGR